MNKTIPSSGLSDPMRQRFFIAGLICLIGTSLFVSTSRAAITAEQRKELKEIGSELGKVLPLIAKKKFDEAATAMTEVEDRLTRFVKEADLKEADPVLKPVHAVLEKAKAQLAKLSGKGTVNFAKDVAAILAKNCAGCHDDNSKGGLRLDTFAGLEKGGNSGPLLLPKNAEGSLLIQRLITPNDQQRMPKGKEALTEKEIRLIATWISEGAKFDGDKTDTLAMLAKSASSLKPMTRVPKAEIVKAAGNEKVHFMADIMPELVDTCGRCHNDTVKRSGFSVVSFEKLMKGGDSGAVIAAGSLENSRLWRLVNGDDTPVMPAGNQTGITRKWYDNLKTWILEGAKFDGDDAKKNFPTLEERESAAMAKFSPEQWLERRKKSSEAEWKKTFPNEEPIRRESAEFLLYGNVTDERLGQLENWVQDQVGSLKQTFKVKDEPLFKGKLAIFVFKERFGYEEFNNSVHRREVPREVIGHSQVNATMEDAFIALQDVGDSATESSPGMQVNLIEHVTGAFLKRGGGSSLPDWVIRGAGLALARQKSVGNPYLAAMPGLASGILRESGLSEPQKIFENGTFSPGEVGPIGFTLVEFMLRRGNPLQFGLFVQRLKAGDAPEAALKAIYQTDGKSLAIAYAGSLPSGPKKGKK